jgi:hypothetical protein
MESIDAGQDRDGGEQEAGPGYDRHQKPAHHPGERVRRVSLLGVFLGKDQQALRYIATIKARKAIKAANGIALCQSAGRQRTAIKETLRVARLSANPPKTVYDKYRGKENFNPGGISYVRTMDTAPQQLNMGDNFPITVEITRMLSQNIKEWYNVDFFLMLRQQQSLQNMTAAAVAALQGEQAALLSALATSLFDGLDRIIQRTFNILAKRRLLPPLPFALREA